MSFKALVTQNERGRSMVEILGVLAVIGVLSIGGIQGYKYAMDKYRANDIVHSVNMRATDIWHLYQDGKKELPDSPDEDAFPEYGEMTQTGFPIMVTSHPPVAFRTWVENVPSSVCQKVLQENLNEAIQGLKFVQVNGDKYADDINICGEGVADNQMVFTSFLDEGGGAVGEPDPNNPFEYCVEEGDCTGGCNASCNERTMRCEDSCMGTDKPYCKETESGGVCVKCTQRSHCLDLGNNYTCSDLTNECVEVPAKCKEGEEFRTKNGVCVACDNASNFMVGLDKFAVEELGIEDDLTGLEQCNACANPNTRYSGTVDEETAYCSYACTKGYSFQTTQNGCISCTDTGGYMIDNDNVNMTQCLACKDHFWYQSPLWTYQYFCDTEQCNTNEGFYYFKDADKAAVCLSCETDGCYYIGGNNTNSKRNTSFFKNKCTACNNRFIFDYRCCKYCDQPEDAEAQIEICKANPANENCTRKWQNTDAKCFSCSENTGSSFVGTDAVVGGDDPYKLGELCRNCGREVNEEGYCIPKGSQACDENQFLGINGKCYPCTQTEDIQVKSSDDKDSGCVANCQSVTDNKWYKGRRILDFEKDGKTVYFCFRTPLENAKTFQGTTGSIYECNKIDRVSFYGDESSKGHGSVIKVLSDECTSRCPDERQLYWGTAMCGLKQCPLINNVKQFQARYGDCVSCNDSSAVSIGHEKYTPPTDLVTKCESCGNRIFVHEVGQLGYSWPYCVLVNPGISGICNNVNTSIPDNLNSDLKDDALEYMNANTGLFRDYLGGCHSCTEKNSYYTSQDQCGLCKKNRRYSGYQCIYGLCEEKSQFLNTSNKCVSCTNKNVAVDPEKENLCGSCENRRMLTTGFKEQKNLAGLCVEECAPGLWQGKNGSCYYDNDPNTYEIGTDLESRNLCIAVDREIVEIVDENDKVVGYECKPKSS